MLPCSHFVAQPPPSDHRILKARLRQLLENNEFSEILKIEISPHRDGIENQRLIMCYQACAFQAIGELDTAEKMYQKLENEFGENVLITANIANTYYYKGDVHKWREHYKKLEKDLLAYSSHLSAYSYFQCHSYLFKCFEEDGFISKAIEGYESIYRNSAPIVEDVNVELIFLPQLVRLKSLMLQKAGLSELYRHLISLDPRHLTRSFQVEIEHALMLAELCLVGPQHALSRVTKIYRDPKISAIDKNLLIIDFIEESHLLHSKGEQLQSVALSEVPVPSRNQLSVFEQQIWQLFCEKTHLSYEQINEISPELNMAEFLRLLTAYYVTEKTPEARQEIFNRLQFLFESVDTNSRQYWMQRFKTFIPEDALTLSIDIHCRILRYQGKELSLSRKKTMATIIELIGKTKADIPIETAMQAIWGCSYSPDAYHRLRMIVHRLNKEIFQLTTVSKALAIDAEVIRRTGRINIEIYSEKL